MLKIRKIQLNFGLSLDLDQTLAQRKAERKAKSKVKVTRFTERREHVANLHPERRMPL